MPQTPPPFTNITGISRADMKYNEQESFADYNGNARPGELVVDLTSTPPAVYVGDNLGQLTQVGQGSGNGVPGGPTPSIQFNNSGAFGGSANLTFANGNLNIGGDIVPLANNISNIGSPARQFRDMYLSNATLYFNSVPLSMAANRVLQFDGADLVSVGVVNSGDIETDAAVIAANVVISNSTPGGGITFADGSIQTSAASYGNANVAALLSGNTVTSNIVTTGNVSGSFILGNISAATGLGNISAINLNGNVQTVLSGNGTFVAQSVGSTYGNANVTTLLSDGTVTSNIITTANVTATNIEATTRFTGVDFFAKNPFGATLKNSAGTTVMNWGGGGPGSTTATFLGPVVMNGIGVNVTISPQTGGSVEINPNVTGKIRNMDIGDLVPRTGTFTQLTATGVTTLGPVANVKITGGTAGQVVTTDGTGNLSFTTVGGGGSSYGDANVTALLEGGTVSTNIITTANVDATLFNAVTSNVVVGTAQAVATKFGTAFNITSSPGANNGDNGVNINITAGDANESGGTPAVGGGIFIDGGLGTTPGDVNIATLGSSNITMGVAGRLINVNTDIRSGTSINAPVFSNQASNTIVRANTESWTFDTTGNLNLPGNTFAVNYANGDPVTFGGGGGPANIIVNGNTSVSIPAANGNIQFIWNGLNAGNISTSSISLGVNAGQIAQGTNAVALGTGAGGNTQSLRAVAIGQNAGNVTQGTAAVAIGRNAGQTTQGQQAVAIGQSAGSTTQGLYAVAIGTGAGSSNQGISAIAIGENAGTTNQGANAVSLGYRAGFNTQGVNAVAIGYTAGQTNQAGNSIVINATGTALDNTTADSLVIKPVRTLAGLGVAPAISPPAGFFQVGYNPTTGEFIYYT